MGFSSLPTPTPVPPSRIVVLLVVPPRPPWCCQVVSLAPLPSKKVFFLLIGEPIFPSSGQGDLTCTPWSPSLPQPVVTHTNFTSNNYSFFFCTPPPDNNFSYSPAGIEGRKCWQPSHPKPFSGCFLFMGIGMPPFASGGCSQLHPAVPFPSPSKYVLYTHPPCIFLSVVARVCLAVGSGALP